MYDVIKVGLKGNDEREVGNEKDMDNRRIFMTSYTFCCSGLYPKERLATVSCTAIPVGIAGLQSAQFQIY